MKLCKNQSDVWCNPYIFFFLFWFRHHPHSIIKTICIYLHDRIKLHFYCTPKRKNAKQKEHVYNFQYMLVNTTKSKSMQSVFSFVFSFIISYDFFVELLLNCLLFVLIPSKGNTNALKRIKSVCLDIPWTDWWMLHLSINSIPIAMYLLSLSSCIR